MPTTLPHSPTRTRQAEVARAEKLRDDVHERLQGGSKRTGPKRAQLPNEVPDGPARGAYLRAKAEAQARASEKEAAEKEKERQRVANPQDLLNRSLTSLGLEGEEDRGTAKRGRRATPQPGEDAGGQLTEQLKVAPCSTPRS